MKLDYLPTGSPDCPLLRLYEFSPGEAALLHNAVSGLATDTADRVEVHGLPFVEAADDCQLALVLRTWDQGAIKLGDGATFECGLTTGSWDNVAMLIEPFADGSEGYQWLVDSPGEVALLLSVDGSW